MREKIPGLQEQWEVFLETVYGSYTLGEKATIFLSGLGVDLFKRYQDVILPGKDD